MKFEILEQPNEDIDAWSWMQQSFKDINECVRNNPGKIIKHKKGYIASFTFNKGISEIIDCIMRMWARDNNRKFPGDICILPTDYHVLDKEDYFAVRGYVTVKM